MDLAFKTKQGLTKTGFRQEQGTVLVEPHLFYA